MKTTTASIVQDPENIVTQEVIATHLEAMSAGIKKLVAGPLTEDTLVLLIQHASPATGNRYNKTKVGKPEIRAILRGIELLAKTHLKPKK